MGFIGGSPAYRVLRALAPPSTLATTGDPAPERSKLVEYFGPDFLHSIQGRTVIDFGCGSGSQAVEMAAAGAARVIGLDLQESRLAAARGLAVKAGVADRCVFATRTEEVADIIISKDAFEHFADPADVLRSMRKLLKSDGCVLAAFGPTWLHPYGGHLFSIFPWSHLLFTETALLRWRSDFKSDGATRFGEVEGGLNEMTIGRFEAIVDEGPFEFAWLETVPIKGLKVLQMPALREWGSSLVRCKLVPRAI